jgi:hypothetical protein
MSHEPVPGPHGEVVVYQDPTGASQVDVRLERDSLWLSLLQIAELFDRDKSVVSRHLRSIFASGELDRQATVAKNATVQVEGGRRVTREIEYFNLDAIPSVGYRVNSKRGTQFRIWATRVLREHLMRGYTLDRRRLESNARELAAVLELVRRAGAGEALTLGLLAEDHPPQLDRPIGLDRSDLGVVAHGDGDALAIRGELPFLGLVAAADVDHAPGAEGQRIDDALLGLVGAGELVAAGRQQERSSEEEREGEGGPQGGRQHRSTQHGSTSARKGRGGSARLDRMERDVRFTSQRRACGTLRDRSRP